MKTPCQADIEIGHRSAEFVDKFARRHLLSLKRAQMRLGLPISIVYAWREGIAPSAKSLQAMAEGGANVNYILTGKGDLWNGIHQREGNG